MYEHSIGAMPVCELSGRMVGIVSERDLVRAGIPADDTKNMISRRPFTCGQFFYGLRREWLPANAPLAAVDLEDLHPCHAAHVFAFD